MAGLAPAPLRPAGRSHSPDPRRDVVLARVRAAVHEGLVGTRVEALVPGTWIVSSTATTPWVSEGGGGVRGVRVGPEGMVVDLNLRCCWDRGGGAC